MSNVATPDALSVVVATADDGNNLPDVGQFVTMGHVELRDILEHVIFPEDPVLARRLNALLWSYERSRLRHSLVRDPLRRRAPRRDDAAHRVRSPQDPPVSQPVDQERSA